MIKRKKLKNTRPKALFGIGETGALIALTAAEVAGHAGQAAAQYFSARSQGENMLKQTQAQADALKEQNENNRQLQTEMMEFTKEQNDENRRVMKDMQMNLQLQAGGQAMRDRQEASKTILKYGGKKKKKHRRLEVVPTQETNMPFRVIDGGGVIPIGQSTQGYDIYELFGNDHDHYHKAQGGKNKTGVGIKFADGAVIEGEGNQGTAQGELMVTTPDDAFFLSKHSIAGFNPADAVKRGMDPIQAYTTQEYIKQMYGITDDGSNPPLRNRATIGGAIQPYYDTFQPYGNLRFIPGATTINYEQRELSNRRNSLKNGGSTKQKIKSIKDRRTAKLGWWFSPTVSGAGNFIGAGLSGLGLGLGSRYLSNRVGEAGNILANAYGQLQGVDMKDVFGDNAKLSFSTGQYMPALRSSYFNANPQLEQVNRDVRRQTNAVNNNTLSSAARLSRTNLANVAGDESRGKIYADKANREEQIKQANNQAINEAAANNAQLYIDMNKNYANAKADLAKFNANVANERVLGAAEARADALTQQGQIKANMWQGIGSAVGNAISQTGLGFANAYNSKLTRENELSMAMLGATEEGIVRMYSNPNSNLVSRDDAIAKGYEYVEKARNASDPKLRDKYIGWANSIFSGWEDDGFLYVTPENLATY